MFDRPKTYLHSYTLPLPKLVMILQSKAEKQLRQQVHVNKTFINENVLVHRIDTDGVKSTETIVIEI